MTYRKWEYDLKCLLQGYPKKEVDELTRYYAEIYGDKKDAGFSDDDILIEFGTPEECAEKFRAEAAAQDSGKKKPQFKLPSADKLTKLILLTVFVYIPLAAAVLSGILTLAALSLGGAGLAVAGLGSIALSFYHAISGNGVAVFLSMLGLGLGGIGVGAIISIAFFFITKYAARSAYKIVIRLYEKIKEGVVEK